MKAVNMYVKKEQAVAAILQSAAQELAMFPANEENLKWSTIKALKQAGCYIAEEKWSSL